MTQEEKELLTKDIFDRVLTGLKVDYNGQTFTLGYNLYLEDGNVAFESYPMKFYLEKIETIKPYLRPMLSMTEEEEKEVRILWNEDFVDKRSIYHCYPKTTDFYNKHHFDYRGLIEKGLALEAPEGMYE